MPEQACQRLRDWKDDTNRRHRTFNKSENKNKSKNKNIKKNSKTANTKIETRPPSRPRKHLNRNRLPRPPRRLPLYGHPKDIDKRESWWWMYLGVGTLGREALRRIPFVLRAFFTDSARTFGSGYWSAFVKLLMHKKKRV